MAALGKTLKAFRAAFRALELPWYLFGAQAAIHYGSSRVTQDVDVTTAPRTRTTTEIAATLVAHGFTLRIPDEDFVRRTSVIPVVHSCGMRADVVLAGPGFEDLFFERVGQVRIDGITVPIASVEDIVVMKVLALREKDRTDVRAMLASKRTDVNVDEVRRTLSLLEAALDQSDLVPAFEALLQAARR